jgi:hypothetical protein
MENENYKKFICENIQMVSENSKINICKLLKNNLSEVRVGEVCFESDDGTRINLDDIDDNLIKEIYTIVKNELRRGI